MRFTNYVFYAMLLISCLVLHSTVLADIYTVTNTDSDGSGSLRQAIVDANAHAGYDTIAFDIPGAGPHTIMPTFLLPTISDPVLIDGYTQPGASPNTNVLGLGSNAVLMIQLDGGSAGPGADGLFINAGGSMIKGLAITRFSGNGITLSDNGDNNILGNFIGTDVTGFIDMGNSRNGINIWESPQNAIGGTGHWMTNLISGNTNEGISIDQTGSIHNIVQSNYIGTDVTGTAALGNGRIGVSIRDASHNIIGSSVSLVGNIIAGNDAAGISINAAYNEVLGNRIGTDYSGTIDLGNGTFGIEILFDTSDGNRIGSGDYGSGNTIAFNGLDGVYINSGTSNHIKQNSIYANDGLGIDLGPPGGVTPNDVGDGDTGANHLQNFPVLTSAHPYIVRGTLNSTPETEYRIEFFSSSECDSSGFGEGEEYLGHITVTTTVTGNINFEFIPADSLEEGQFITATATRSFIGTSEFSECATVASGFFDLGSMRLEYPSPVWRGFPFPMFIEIWNLGPDDAPHGTGSYSILDQDQSPLQGYPQPFGPFEIPAGERFTYQFEWTPDDTGTFFIQASFQADGDKNPENDSLTVPVRVYDKSQGTVGDVNGDGQANVLDAVTLINFILGTVDFSELEGYRADCNRDGEKNILDVLGIVNGILGISSCASACEDLDCNDGNPCTVDYCDSNLVRCIHEPVENGSTCDDGDACTENDKCIDGDCQGTEKECDDNDPCTDDDCDPETGCSFIELCCENGSDDDGDGLPDCDDDDCLFDADSDGYYAWPCGDDCDDGDAAVHPGATEICTDGIDNDCDGPQDCNDDDCLVDADGDGYDTPPCGEDCDDTDNTVYPGAAEDCTDGVDNDCDGPLDCNDDDCLVDADSDGSNAPPCGDDCDDMDEDINPWVVEICTDQVDNDCDGDMDCADGDCLIDSDGDGHYAYPCGQDCDDNDNTVYPGASEICDDGKDNDCNQAVDCQDNACIVDSDGDQYYAQPCGNDCDDNDQGVHPGSQENCQDKKDNDCDEKTDCDDTDCANDPNCP